MRRTSIAMLAAFLAFVPGGARAGASDRDVALAGLRGDDVVRIRLAAGAVIEGPWQGLAGDSLRLGGERPVAVEQIDRVQVRRPMRGVSAAGIGVLWGLAAGWLTADADQPLSKRTFRGGDAALGAVAGAGVGAWAGARVAHWATLWVASRPGLPGVPVN